jgi:hypothetical protein
MPVATVTDSDVKVDLKSIEGGYVVIRRATYGEKLKTKSMMSSIRMELGDKKTGNISQAHIELFEEKVTNYEFANFISDHNLTDEKQKPLNFKNAADVARLRGQIGEEISDRMKEVNDFEDNEEVKN